jgi:hypothetical protein
VCTYGRKRKQSGAVEATLDDDIEEDDILYATKAADEEGFEGLIEAEDEGDVEEDLIYEEEGEEPDGEIDPWDLALKEFPAEQDEVDLAPTPEEAERNAAFKLVRASELPEGVELEVEDAVEEVEARPLTFKDQLAGLSVRGELNPHQHTQGWL